MPTKVPCGLPLALIITLALIIKLALIIIKLSNSLEVSLTVQNTEASVSITALPDQKHFSSRLEQPPKIIWVKAPPALYGAGIMAGP